MTNAMRMMLLANRKNGDNRNEGQNENRMNYGEANYDRQNEYRGGNEMRNDNRYDGNRSEGDGRYEGGRAEYRSAGMNYERRNEYRGGNDSEMRGGESRYEQGRNEMDRGGRGGGEMNRSELGRNEMGMGMDMNCENPESRFRDRYGREHYDNGRFAPRNEIDEIRIPTDPPYVRPMNRIGFVSETEINPDYKATAKYERMQEMDSQQMPADSMPGHASMNKKMRIDKETAAMWMQQLENEDGTKGAHWTMEQTKQVMAQHGIQCDPLEFYVALNMIYSDYGKILKKHGVGDKIAVYADLAKAFLDDKDAMPNKLENYYKAVVKR